MKETPRTYDEVAELNPRDRIDLELPDDMTVSFVPMPSVNEFSATILDRVERPLSAVRKGYTRFREGDVLWAKITPCMENGKTALATGLTNGIGFGSTEFHVLRAKPRVLPKLIWYSLRRSELRKAAKQSMRGAAGQQRVPEHFLRQYPCGIPQDEGRQEHLVAILDEADALRRKRREADEIRGRLAEVIFDQMFASQGDTSPWPRIPLGDRIDFLTSGARGWAQYVRPSGRLFLRIQNVKAGRLLLNDVAYVDPPENEETNRTATRAGDVLLSITADLGRTCVIPDGTPQAHINQHLALLRSTRIDPHYLSSFLSSPLGLKGILEKNRAAVKAALNFTDIRSLLIPEPPRKLQSSFAQKLHEVHQADDKAQTSATALDTLFQTLLERAFDGLLSEDHRTGLTRETAQEMAIQSRRTSK